VDPLVCLEHQAMMDHQERPVPQGQRGSLEVKDQPVAQGLQDPLVSLVHLVREETLVLTVVRVKWVLGERQELLVPRELLERQD